MAAEATPWWRRLNTVRARTTAAATLIVGLALAIAAVSLVLLLRRSLVQHVDDVAEARATDVAALVEQGSLPSTLAATGDDSGLTQIVDETGRVLAATAGLRADRPIVAFRPSGSEPEVHTVEGLPVAPSGTFRVLGLRTDAGGRPMTIYVATSLEPVEDAIGTLRGALAVGTPVLLALVALTGWILVGRALHPVDAIRAEADVISDRSLDRRVPVPSADDEISRLASTMNRMLNRLETAALRQRRFVADASHELQTPLASARTDLEVALAHPDHTDWQDTARDLLDENHRMERLVRDLLFLARAEDGSVRPAVPVDLDDVVLSEAARLRGDGRRRVDTSRVSAAEVNGRRDELARAVGNLLDNADRYASSLVEIELEGSDHGVILVVEDDGPGIPADDRERIFERFSRLDDARSRGSGGTGLGLAIVKEIIVAHGGTISVTDAPRGARFVIHLPAA